jgi:uncharacterized membrane protein
MEDNMEQRDLDNNGIVDTVEQQLYERKAVNRRRMAWVALIAMIVTALLLMFVVPSDRITLLEEILAMYFIALGSIVGAYVGISTWMTKK